MAACEKCWRDASLAAQLLGGSVSDHYHRLLAERKDNPCTEAEQSGRCGMCLGTCIVQFEVDGGTDEGDCPECSGTGKAVR